MVHEEESSQLGASGLGSGSVLHGILTDAPNCTLSSFASNPEVISLLVRANTMSTGEALLRAAEAPLFWLGALTASWASLCLVCRLLSGFKVWVLGNGRFMSPHKLGKWAGETRVQNTLDLLLQISKPCLSNNRLGQGTGFRPATIVKHWTKTCLKVSVN